MTIGETANQAPGADRKRGKPQLKVGKVVSSKMNKTILVEVEGSTTHRLYLRQSRRTNKFAAHDEKNEAKVGDRVLLESTRPLSKTKRWRVREILKRAEVIEP